MPNMIALIKIIANIEYRIRGASSQLAKVVRKEDMFILVTLLS